MNGLKFWTDQFFTEPEARLLERWATTPARPKNDEERELARRGVFSLKLEEERLANGGKLAELPEEYRLASEFDWITPEKKAAARWASVRAAHDLSLGFAPEIVPIVSSRLRGFARRDEPQTIYIDFNHPIEDVIETVNHEVYHLSQYRDSNGPFGSDCEPAAYSYAERMRDQRERAQSLRRAQQW